MKKMRSTAECSREVTMTQLSMTATPINPMTPVMRKSLIGETRTNRDKTEVWPLPVIDNMEIDSLPEIYDEVFGLKDEEEGEHANVIIDWWTPDNTYPVDSSKY